MNSTIRTGVLVALDVLIGFAVIGVLPFAWILKDGLGPGAVPTSGLAAVYNTFMCFYIGPVILLLVSLDLVVRRFVPAVDSPLPKRAWIIWMIAFISVALLSYGMVLLLFEG